MIFTKNLATYNQYDIIELRISDFSQAQTVGDLIDLAKEEMKEEQKNYHWLLHKIAGLKTEGP